MKLFVAWEAAAESLMCLFVGYLSHFFFLDVHLMSCLFLQCKLLCSPGKVCSTPLPSCCVVVLVLVALHWLDGPDLLQTAVFVQDLIAIY